MVYLGWAVGLAGAIAITVAVAYLIEQWEDY
ncbi:Uncharacterised protein [Anaerobiospirillum thomasii]|uniref:Uncharacterized protein n=1 Tax=Anaerobiospirillum thomasii TaxID=179995 RepID=A0A2X0WP89_9GAMM|nr:Uncharacterised protein [Anaerobiospirillum thomasii]SPT72327.1 Uncharacterised protein [Anaerobiospirillum thomasii]